MSKRFGNIINPDSIISTFGADTLRMYEMFMGPFDQAVSWNTDSLIGPRRFIERVWKLGMSKAAFDKKSVSKTAFDILLNKTIKKVAEDIEAMKFNTAVSTLMILSNEMEKSEVGMEDYKKFLQILAPFAPHVTEELWQNLGKKKSIHLSSWPKWDENLIKDEEVKIVIQINGKVRAEMLVEVDESEEEIKKKAQEHEAILKYINGQNINKIIYVKNRLINIVV